MKDLAALYKERTMKLNDASGCIVWLGAKESHGYGAIRVGQQTLPAHRVFYEYFKKTKIPVGWVIDHLCRNPACVNIEHLEAVTYSINTLRGNSYNGTKTHCKRGHEFTPENTYLSPGRKQRRCKKCVKLFSLGRTKI